MYAYVYFTIKNLAVRYGTAKINQNTRGTTQKTPAIKYSIKKILRNFHMVYMYMDWN